MAHGMFKPPLGRRRALGLAAALPTLLATQAGAEWLRDEVVLYADPALRPTFAVLAARFRAAAGIRVRIFCAPARQMLALLAHGTQDDLLITETAPLAEAKAAGLVGPARTLWRNRLVLAAAGPAAPPLPLDPSRLHAALAGGRLAAPDPSDASPLDGPALLRQLGLTDLPLLGAADTEDAAAALKRGEAAAALCHASQVAADPGLRVLMRIPDAAYDPIDYAIALSHHAWSRNQERLTAWLTHEAAPMMQPLGLEVLA